MSDNPLDLVKSDDPFAFEKAKGHKYKSRKKVKGKWVYDYGKKGAKPGGKKAESGNTTIHAKLKAAYLAAVKPLMTNPRNTEFWTSFAKQSKLAFATSFAKKIPTGTPVLVRPDGMGVGYEVWTPTKEEPSMRTLMSARQVGMATPKRVKFTITKDTDPETIMAMYEAGHPAAVALHERTKNLMPKSEAMNPLDLVKSDDPFAFEKAGHKYVSRKKVGGKWVYDYGKKGKKKTKAPETKITHETYRQALFDAQDMGWDAGVRSTLKEAGIGRGIPYGDEMGEFVTWAEKQLGLSQYKSDVNPLDLVKASSGFSTRVGSVDYGRQSNDPSPGFQGRHLSDIAKAEGSRGGKVIGHTGSGKPIYASHGGTFSGHTKGYSEDDHADAWGKHSALSEEHEEAGERAELAGDKEASSDHSKAAAYHHHMAASHDAEGKVPEHGGHTQFSPKHADHAVQMQGSKHFKGDKPKGWDKVTGKQPKKGSGWGKITG